MKKTYKYVVVILVCLLTMQPLFAQKKTASDSIENLISKGIELFGESKFPQTLSLFYQALKIAEKHNLVEKQGVIYSNLVPVYRETGKYDMTKKMGAKALSILLKTNNYKAIASTYNNLGVMYYEQYMDSAAFVNYKTSLRYSHKANDSLALFAGYKNIGAYYYEVGDTLAGIQNTQKSMLYLPKNKNPLKWFSGYLTLGEIYTYSGNIDIGKKYLDSAALYLPKLNANHKFKDYHYALHEYYKGKGNYQEALKEYYLYKSLTDSIVGIEKSKELDEINVRYETEKKDKKIIEQRLKIQKEKTTKVIYISGLSFMVIILLISMVFYRRKQRVKTQKLLQEQHEKSMREIFDAEQKERIRIARDLHDSIGQKLAVMKMLLPSKSEFPDVEKIANYLDETTAEVRSISHNLIPEILSFGIIKAVASLAERINSTENIQVSFFADDSIKELQLSKQTELSLYRIIQEITSNIVRHSKTKELKIELKQQTNLFQIIIADNGVGFDNDAIDSSSGLGWKNIYARIKLVNGNIKIHSEKNKGSNFLINIPVV